MTSEKNLPKVFVSLSQNADKKDIVIGKFPTLIVDRGSRGSRDFLDALTERKAGRSLEVRCESIVREYCGGWSVYRDVRPSLVVKSAALPGGFRAIQIAPIMEFPTVSEANQRRALIDVPVRFSAVGSKNSSRWIQPRQLSRGVDPGRAVLDRNAA